MKGQSALSNKIDKVASTLVAEIEQIKASLEAKVPPEIDLSAEIAKLDKIEAAIAGIIPDADAEPPTVDETLEPTTETPSSDPTGEAIAGIE